MLHLYIKMIVRPSRSTQSLSTGGSRQAEFLNFKITSNFSALALMHF